MGDDRTDLIESHLKQIEALRKSVDGLKGGQQQAAALAIQWNTMSDMLATKVLPKLGAAVQLAARGMMATITWGFSAVAQTEGIKFTLPNVGAQDFSPHFRTLWAGLVTGQLAELEKLLKDPPELVPSPPSVPAEGEKPDRATAKALLEDAVSDAAARENSIRGAGYRALLVGSLAALGAAAIPFFLDPGTSCTGWQLVAGWGVRVLAVGALVVLAVHLFNVFRDMMGRAAATSRERAHLKVLAASAFLGTGKDQAAALVDLVRSLNVEPQGAAADDRALVLPPTVVKELPELIKLLKTSQ